MALSPHEQFFTALQRSKRPLIILKEMATIDDFTAAFGIASLLTKLEKPADIVSAGGRAPESLQFLAHAQPIKGDLPNIRSLTLKVNVEYAKVDELSYTVVDHELQIHITPKSGEWTEKDVAISTTSYRYDLIIAIGLADLKSLGPIYDKYADFLFHTPIINIDHSPANEHFGHMNLIDVTASAVSEVCFELFRRIDEQLVDADVATCFLAGMIAKTKSFRAPNVTPKTLEVAGALMAKGARRDEIVERLYRTRSVETLRLWGRALARLKADAEFDLAWTMLTRQDFVNAGADESSLNDIVSELLSTSPSARIVAIFFEQNDGSISVHLHAERPHDALRLGAPFRAAGTREVARLTLPNTDIVAAERAVISHLRKTLAE